MNNNRLSGLVPESWSAFLDLNYLYVCLVPLLFWMTLTFPFKGHWIAIISLVHFPHLGPFSQTWLLCTSLSSFSKLSYYLQLWISSLDHWVTMNWLENFLSPGLPLPV